MTTGPTAILLHNARLVGRAGVAEGGWLAVREGRIAMVGGPGVPVPDASALSAGPDAVEQLDLGGRFVLPGFVDIHTHGGAGASLADPDPAQARIAADHHLSQGTTTLLGSTVTGPLGELEQQLPFLAGLVEAGVLAGIHLEGPFIAAARCGAHEPTLLRAPEPAVLARLLDLGRGTIRMVTLAPELDHAIAAVELLAERGVIAAFGHTDATYAQTSAAIDAGARVATHSFNGMRPVHHREPGPMIAALERDEVFLEVVNDGVHVHPAVVRHLFSSAGADRVTLISDAMSAAGAPDGRYRLGPMTVDVAGGVARVVHAAEGGGEEEIGGIAGSTITLGHAVRNAVREVGLTIEQASTAASLTPARALGLAGRIGSLGPGKDADLVVLDPDLATVGVMCKGVWAVGPGELRAIRP
ncbi:MAG TPA: N-acetylglucosamine-6-phosphate deacetylase [Actinocrinis sp.]|nr:N-acetylglucosamine-6-phosphate deacetylase [Actinocrinis sp.]